jgi:L,D-transpeptidase YcbB
MTHSFRIAVAALLIGAAGPALAQTDRVGTQGLRPVDLLPATPPSSIAPSQAATPAVSPPQMAPQWSRGDAEELLAYIERVGEEGLDPADYGPDRLRAAIDGGDQTALNAAATSSFLKLSSDLALGHVRGDARVEWYMEDPDLNGNEQYALMARAVEQHNVADALASLLPTHPQYGELKTVLAGTSDPATREKIRTNMDRWRWLPRDLGRKYVLVNVPAYSVALVEDGRVLSRRRAVAGAVKTATPQLSTTISGAIFNPWWEVPKSIAPEVRGKKGYVSVPTGDGGVRWRQPPGPRNSLGRVKLVMPNNHAIFLHDTNAQNLFDTKQRAYSHGCIRTEDAVGFAATLLEQTEEWDRSKIDEGLASGKTFQANMKEPVPVYIAYFTAAAVAEKNEIVSYKDIYNRDKPVTTALSDSGRSGTALASAD